MFSHQEFDLDVFTLRSFLPSKNLKSEQVCDISNRYWDNVKVSPGHDYLILPYFVTKFKVFQLRDFLADFFESRKYISIHG